MSTWRHIFDGAPTRALDAGATLFRREEPVRSMYLVRCGEIALERPMPDGGALTLHTALKGAALAEASLFADAYHCDAVARKPTIVAWVARADFLAALRRAPEAALELLAVGAAELQQARARMEVLRLRRVRDRLDAWLDLAGAPARGEWIRVAEAIGVSPAALYRELARRRRA